jgi:hypothetical protein
LRALRLGFLVDGGAPVLRRYVADSLVERTDLPL